MPLLSFQVQAEYDKVIRLRNEIEKLKSEMKSVNAIFDADRFNSYNKRLKEATTEFNALVDSAAKAGAKVNSSIQAMSRTVDLSNQAKELKKFDGQVDELCKHINTYFDFLKGKLQDTLTMLNEVGSIADKVNVDDKNVGHIEELKRQNAELTSEIQRQIAAYEEQQSRFQALSDAIRTNNVPALQQLAEQEDEASKRLKLDEARNSLKGVTDDMKSLAAQMAETQGDVERLESLLDSLKNSHLDDGNAIKDSQYLETEQALESAIEKLAGMKKEYNEMAILQKQYSDQVQQTSGHQERLRTQIMNAREDMVKLIAAGQAGTPTFNEIVSQTGKMRMELALANAYMQYFADPNRSLATLKQSMEGAAGGASLLVGVMGLFNQKSEEMEMIQTKLQSLLGIIVGLETTYAAVKKTSNVMIAIGQIQSWASAKAKAAETVATEAGTVATIKATAAQAMFNTVAKANPYLALLSIITLVVGGIYTLAKALGSETDEQKKAAEAAKEHAEEIRKQHEAWAHSVANSAAKQIMSYKNLQKKWEELGNDLKAKEKFVTDNKTAFNDLGFSVDNVTQAENLLIKNTDAVVNAIMARAKAAAYEKVATEELERQIRIELEKGTVANGAYRKNFKKGQRLSLDEARELERESGVSIVGANSKSTKGVAFSTDVEVTNENVLNNAAKKAAENRRKRYLADRTKRIQESKDKVKLIQENARQEYEAEKAAVEQTGVPQFTPTKTTLRNGGNTSDRLHAIIDKQKLDEQRRAIDLEFSTREAQIKAMQDGTDKVLEQLKLDRERKEEAIRRSYEDMRLKRIEEARKVWEADPKNKGENFYESSEYSSANVNTKAETDNRDARLMVAKIEYNKAVKELRDADLQSMREYLKEYGTLEQQVEAITKEYQDKIDKARSKGDEGAVLLLEKKMQEAISKVKLDNLIKAPEFIKAFEDLGNVSTETIERMIGKFEDVKEEAAKNLKPDQLREYTDTLERMHEELRTRDPFKALTDSLKELKAAHDDIGKWEDIIVKIKAGEVVKDEDGNAIEMTQAEKNLSDARNREIKATNNLKKSIADVANSLSSFSSALKELGNEIGGKTGEAMNAVGGIFDSFSSVLNGVKNFDSKAKGIQGTMGKVSLIMTAATAMIQMNKALDSILPDEESLYNHYAAKWKKINDQRRAMIELEMAQLEERLKNEAWFYENGMTQLKRNAELNEQMFKAYGEAFAAPQEVYQEARSGFSKWGPAIIGAIVGIIIGVITYGSGAAAGVAAGTSIAGALGGGIATAVGISLTSTMASILGSVIIGGVSAAVANAIRAGYDSITYKDGQTAAADNLRVQTRHKTFFRSEKTQDLESWVRENWGEELWDQEFAEKFGKYGVKLIDPEVAKKLLEDGPTLVGETEETVKKLMEYSEKIHEFLDQIHEYVSQAFSPLVDNLSDALWDWLADGKDVMDSFRDYAADTFRKIAQDAIKAMIMKNIFDPFQEQLEGLLVAYSTGQTIDGVLIDEAGYMLGVSKIAEEMQKKIEEQMPVLQHTVEIMDSVMKNIGIDITGKSSGSQQTATSNAIQNITQDQANALEGRVTAMQIAVEQGNTKNDAIIGQMTVTNMTLSDMRSLSATQCDIADDTRDILANSYLELRDINDHQGKIEKAVVALQSDVQEMKKIVDDRL